MFALNTDKGQLGGALLVGWAAVLGIQALAVYAAVAMALHLPAFFAVPLSIALGTGILLAFPLGATIIGAMAAALVWHWPLWLVVLMFFPLGVLNFMIGGTAGIARFSAVLRRDGHTT